MYSEDIIDAPHFDHVEIASISDDDLYKLKHENWKASIKNNALSLYIPDWKRAEIDKNQKTDLLKNVQTRIKNHKDQDTRLLLDDIMKLINT